MFTIRRPDDFHVHFRRGQILRTVVPYTATQFGRALVMPNTTPKPILTSEDALDYRHEILECVHEFSGQEGPHADFNPLMTIQITDDTTPAIIREARGYEFVIAGKVYPKGVTTNSHNGVSDFRKLYPVFTEMEKCGLVLCLHGQVPASFCLDREKDFLTTLAELAKDFPNLRIVMEHISTKESVEAVKSLPDTVAATITAHHLLLTLHDVLSHVGSEGNEGLCPHHYCQPIPQRPEDLEALLLAATGGNPKFFFGSDTAPHTRKKKESDCGCAGVFSAPVILPVLAKVFSRTPEFSQGAGKPLEKFTSIFGSHFYGLPINDGSITLKKEPWIVPEICNGIVPLYAGKILEYKVE